MRQPGPASAVANRHASNRQAPATAYLLCLIKHVNSLYFAFPAAPMTGQSSYLVGMHHARIHRQNNRADAVNCFVRFAGIIVQCIRDASSCKERPTQGGMSTSDPF